MNLTIDVGTTNTKISLWNEVDFLMPVDQKKIKTPKIKKNDFENFDPKKLFNDILTTINKFKDSSKLKISCISIASVGESGVLIDESGNVVSEMIAWYDNRSQSVINSLSNEDKENISKITGLPVSPHYSASKIRWLLNEKVSDTKNYIWLCIPDFIAYKLTGKMRTEFSIASKTMLLDIKRRVWSEDVKKIFKITNVNLPPIIAAGEKVGNVKSYFINSLGIAHNAYVTIAGHDHMVGSYSCNQSKNELLDSTGTTEGILLLTEKLRMKNLDQKNGISYGIYVRQNVYTAFTSLPSAGSIIEWFKNIFHLSDETFELLLKEVYDDYLNENITKDKVNLVIPHFNGSGSPVKSSQTLGLWYGLTNETSVKDLLFGLFLGLTFELKHAVTSMTDSGFSFNKIKLIGPGTKDPLWVQLRADILRTDVYALQLSEAVSRGANKVIKSNIIEKGKGKLNYKKYVPNTNELTTLLLETYKNKYEKLYDAKINSELNL